jgi:hypothetical protein
MNVESAELRREFAGHAAAVRRAVADLERLQAAEEVPLPWLRSNVLANAVCCGIQVACYMESLAESFDELPTPEVRERGPTP